VAQRAERKKKLSHSQISVSKTARLQGNGDRIGCGSGFEPAAAVGATHELMSAVKIDRAAARVYEIDPLCDPR
jgi:hypothetical protein